MTGPTVRMVYGGLDQAARASLPNGQAQGETIAAVTRRMIPGPQKNGHFSLQAFVDAVSGPTSVTGLTVWYSNVPNPSLANDNDWSQDASAGLAPVIALTGTGKAFVNVGNVNAEYIMLKADVTAGSSTIRVFARVEGADNR